MKLSVADTDLTHQWARVLRFVPGDAVELFDRAGRCGRYHFLDVGKGEATLERVADAVVRTPSRNVTLCFALLKKDKNDWVLQKCTELGVSRFVPIISARTEKTGFAVERAQKIVVEAAEQCGRTDVPEVREPLPLKAALASAAKSGTAFVCDEGGEVFAGTNSADPVGFFIGPEGGWTEEERALFAQAGVGRVEISTFTLRAETAGISVVTLSLQG